MMSPSELQALLHEQIPISSAMGIRVTHADHRSVTLAAPLHANHNHAGTVFAGSQHALASLAGWALLRRWAEAAHWQAELVLGKAEIRYLRPASADITVRAAITDAQLAGLRTARDEGGTARLDLTLDLEANNTVCARFKGHYVARASPSSPV
ncbi:YiiD C-terminal domain-containing protein [Aquisalimonas sp.]|uniref:YiiD C-terminal domain-containing protein n=1 Tax=Aquisalimonas sp. TaxID=1872621 RepID=UPI0025C0BA8C|nr:YiiD C-terminal domain-containing protein [Aquisalimonas sp.]